MTKKKKKPQAKKPGKALARRRKTEVQEKISNGKVTRKIIEDYLFGSGTVLTKAQKSLFIQTALQFNLNPFKREVWAVPFEEKHKNEKNQWVSYEPNKYRLSVITGYEVYLKRGERSGKLAGWKVWTDGQGDQLKAFIEIHRSDWKDPFRHEVLFREYNKKHGLWFSHPRTMIKKVAIAQGFRLAFPEEAGGLPYIREEVDMEYKIEEKAPIKTIKGKVQPGTKQASYEIPKGCLPDTLCKIGAYANNPKPYGDLPLEQLIMLYGKAKNPKELEGVLSFVINEKVEALVDQIDYTVDDMKTLVKADFKVENYLDLTWQDRMKVMRKLQNIKKKKEAA